jgi:hypothetical protein
VSEGGADNTDNTDNSPPEDGTQAMDAMDTEQMGLEGMGTHDDGPDSGGFTR